MKPNDCQTIFGWFVQPAGSGIDVVSLQCRRRFFLGKRAGAPSASTRPCVGGHV